MTPNTISPTALRELTAKGQARCLVDVRTPAEYEEVHVEGAHLMSLDKLDAAELRAALKPATGEKIYLLCKSGRRAQQAAEKLSTAGVQNCVVVEGGTDACVASGFDCKRGAKTLPLDQQVRVTLGVIILASFLFAHLVHPYFIWIAAFIGAGLVFSGLTGFCGMALLLAKAPWNQSKK